MTPLFKPALILHGGAGNLERSRLPPDLYAQYHASLLRYLRSTKALLDDGASALDAAVHAVSLMEDDVLFNCGRGSVFTSAGTIEMEASVMVTSATGGGGPGAMKRGAGVMGLRNVRHPIQLARESLLRSGCAPDGRPTADGGSMHAQLHGAYAEERARAWGLEFMPDEWFWTKRRWEEHRRGLEGDDGRATLALSQGTVGCVCLDSEGCLAVATSTGGLTNKWPGRIGDTPTLGAGFWAEAWMDGEVALQNGVYQVDGEKPAGGFWDVTLGECVAPLFGRAKKNASRDLEARVHRSRAAAVSGTGNGDSFLRVAAARTACAMLRFSGGTLAGPVNAVAGRGGELQRSAGQRWGVTGEGEGGMIGIEADMELPESYGREADEKRLRRGKVVFDYNCAGMWRAWVEEGEDGMEIERVMVYREPYR
ncbi:nucleophile aminohydrolase [Aspergillus ambiguus]|uniref:isoaspartyl peptidase/L-asparaginase n=1 Tax=Aspergillus ambiguus TaxID=176160 RepID=UPI003CCDAA1B